MHECVKITWRVFLLLPKILTSLFFQSPGPWLCHWFLVHCSKIDFTCCQFSTKSITYSLKVWLNLFELANYHQFLKFLTIYFCCIYLSCIWLDRDYCPWRNCAHLVVWKMFGIISLFSLRIYCVCNEWDQETPSCVCQWRLVKGLIIKYTILTVLRYEELWFLNL